MHSPSLETCMKHTTLWQRGIDTFHAVTPWIFPSSPSSTWQLNHIELTFRRQLILTRQQLIIPLGRSRHHLQLLPLVLCSRICYLMLQKERKKYNTPHFNQNSVCWRLEKNKKNNTGLPVMSAVSVFTTLPPLFSLTWNVQFLCLLSGIGKEELHHPSINFHSRVPLGIWLHFGGDCKVQAGVISLHSC